MHRILPPYRSPVLLLALAALLGALSCGGSDEGGAPALDSAEALEAALATASSGAVLELTAPRYEGHFTVPAGVTVVGGGATLVGVDGRAVFQLTGGEGSATTLRDLNIENSGLAVVATGGGEVELDQVTVEVSALGGVFAEGLAALTLRDVTVVGSLTPDNVDDALELDASQHPIVGLLTSQIDDLDAERLNIRGFAGFGAALLSSDTRWSAGGVQEWVGTGVLVEGGAAQLIDVEVVSSLRSDGLQVIPNGVAATAGAVLTTERLSVRDTVGYGLLQDNARAVHTDLAVQGHGRAGVWAQDSAPSDGPALTIQGASTIADNLGLGLYLRGVTGVELQGLTVSNTGIRAQPVGRAELVDLGDGIQMVGPGGVVRLDDVLLSGNARVGWLLDGDGLGDAFALQGAVQVAVGELEEPSEALGVLSQNVDEAITQTVSASIASSEFAEQDAAAQQAGVTLGVLERLEVVVGLGDSLGGVDVIGDGGLIDAEGRLRSGGASVDEFGIVVENGQ